MSMKKLKKEKPLKPIFPVARESVHMGNLIVIFTSACRGMVVSTDSSCSFGMIRSDWQSCNDPEHWKKVTIQIAD